MAGQTFRIGITFPNHQLAPRVGRVDPGLDAGGCATREGADSDDATVADGHHLVHAPRPTEAATFRSADRQARQDRRDARHHLDDLHLEAGDQATSQHVQHVGATGHLAAAAMGATLRHNTSNRLRDSTIHPVSAVAPRRGRRRTPAKSLVC
jgi:hypothetical protein